MKRFLLFLMVFSIPQTTGLILSKFIYLNYLKRIRVYDFYTWDWRRRVHLVVELGFSHPIHLSPVHYIFGGHLSQYYRSIYSMFLDVSTIIEYIFLIILHNHRVRQFLKPVFFSLSFPLRQWDFLFTLFKQLQLSGE
jgi:hypothetical protein